LEVRRTHLYKYHIENAKMTIFAGFEMPLWYEGIIPEHMAVREGVGIFDVTHMGRSIVSGPEAATFLDYILSRKVSDMKIFQGRYSVMLNDYGGIIDDLTLFRLSQDEYLIVYNASNREKDYKWITRNSECYGVVIKDISDSTPMFAVQGPKSIDTLKKIFGSDVENIKRYWGKWFKLDNLNIFITRTGYTGEDGFELYLWDVPMEESVEAIRIWNLILEAGEEYNIKPCGLGARDTLRLEAGMCLYDHDISEDTNPFEAGLSFVVSLDKESFIGKNALLKAKENIKRYRVGIRMIDKSIPRQGYKIYSIDKSEIGIVTSGSFSPILKTGIAMGYVYKEYSGVGNEVYIDIRGKMSKGIIVKMPFYDTDKYGWRRKKN